MASRLFAFLSGESLAQDRPLPVEPNIFGASDEGEATIRSARTGLDLVGSLFAAEPLVANPVSFFVDARGRVLVCESFRQGRGVTDNRNHPQAWVDADLAAETVDERRTYHQQQLGPDAESYIEQDDRIRVLLDTDDDGVADESHVFADQFNDLVEGTSAGVLELNGDVFYTCIPNLWKMRDLDGDGMADSREVLHTGYGVKVAYRGDDLHGLRLGPDGRLYFSIGDRGANVETPSGRVKNTESGSIFRCELDGTNLEIFATGLRNPQELVFDGYGNLFTGDNNSDSGDRARWVYDVEGGDSGWRMAYQYLRDRGPFNREKLWYPFHDAQAAYIVPPVANVSDGPSGLDYYPGTGFSNDFNGRFFLVDFRGTPSRSGVRSFRVEPDGAFFQLVAGDLGIAEAAPVLASLINDESIRPDQRANALRALAKMTGEESLEAIHGAVTDGSVIVRAAGLELLPRFDPAGAVGLLEHAATGGENLERQAAISSLAQLGSARADEVLIQLMKQLVDAELTPEVHLETLAAARGRDDARLRTLVEMYDAKLDPARPADQYRETLYGGDSTRGRQIFQERTSVSCVRCRKVFFRGGEVGPELSRIGADKDRQYLLESLVDPNKAIAEGFESVLLLDEDGKSHVGVLKEETDSEIVLMDADAKSIAIPKATIEERRPSQSAMPNDVVKQLNKAEVRDLVEYLASLTGRRRFRGFNRFNRGQ